MKVEIQEFHKNGYFLYRQLVNTDLSLFFMNYLGLKKLCFETNDSTPGAGGHWGDTIVGDVYNLYGDAMFDTLLVTLQPTVEQIAKEKLYPTYSYARWYTNGNFMNPHKDRSECSVSVTMNLGGDVWPFYIIDLKGKEHKIELMAGDGVIYQGAKLRHWRLPFEKNVCAQAFLHYSNNKKHSFDGRKHLGLPANLNNPKLKNRFANLGSPKKNKA